MNAFEGSCCQYFGCFQHFSQTNLDTTVRTVRVEVIDHLIPWGFFMAPPTGETTHLRGWGLSLYFQFSLLSFIGCPGERLQQFCRIDGFKTSSLICCGK